MNTQFFNSKEIPLFFTSDSHLMHANIIKFCERPFKDVHEMNIVICDNWNNTVPKDAIVFVLGDFCFGGKKHWNEYVNRLNGFIWLIKGNHDREKNIPIPHEKFNWIDGFLNIKIKDEEIEGNMQYVTLCHYPMLSWYQSHRGSWNLYGHLHGQLSNKNLADDKFNIKSKITPRQLDVGVDIHNYTPLSWEEVKVIITKQCIK